MEGPQSLLALIEQLEGFEAPAAAWEGEIFPSRLVEYEPAWLDALCLSGEVVWARLTPGAPAKNGLEKSRSGPYGAHHCTAQTQDFGCGTRFSPPLVEEMTFSRSPRSLRLFKARGASFSPHC